MAINEHQMKSIIRAHLFFNLGKNNQHNDDHKADQEKCPPHSGFEDCLDSTAAAHYNHRK